MDLNYGNVVATVGSRVNCPGWQTISMPRRVNSTCVLSPLSNIIYTGPSVDSPKNT